MAPGLGVCILPSLEHVERAWLQGLGCVYYLVMSRWRGRGSRVGGVSTT